MGRLVRVLVGIVLLLAGVAVWWSLPRRAVGERRTGVRRTTAGRVAIPLGDSGRAPVAVATRSAPEPKRRSRTDDPARPFGAGSAAAAADGAGPEGWTIKGNADSGLYHTPSSPSWKRMRAGVWFQSEEAAEGAGFKPWDWRRRAS